METIIMTINNNWWWAGPMLLVVVGAVAVREVIGEIVDEIEDLRQ